MKSIVLVPQWTVINLMRLIAAFDVSYLFTAQDLYKRYGLESGIFDSEISKHRKDLINKSIEELYYLDIIEEVSTINSNTVYRVIKHKEE